MKTRVNKNDLLKQLESVLPGLSNREIIEQSTCFIFMNKKVYTFNEEICCSIDTGIDVCGAVQSGPLLTLLRKLPEEHIDIKTGTDGMFRITCKKRRAGINMENEILLPIDDVEEPGKWKRLADDFLDGVEAVESAASTNEQDFATTCIHIMPDYMEAMNAIHVARFTTKTKFKEEALVRRDSLKNIINLGVTHFSRTASWIHFKNSAGMVISCRLYEDEFNDLSKLVETKGKKVKFSKSIVGATDIAKDFTADNPEDNYITVSLNNKRWLLRGQGATGFFEEIGKVTYKGKPRSFDISPEMLTALVKSNEKAWVSSEKMLVKHGKLVYTAWLRVQE